MHHPWMRIVQTRTKSGSILLACNLVFDAFHNSRQHYVHGRLDRRYPSCISCCSASGTDYACTPESSPTVDRQPGHNLNHFHCTTCPLTSGRRVTAKYLPNHHLRYLDGKQPRCKTNDIEELLSTRHLETCKTWKSRETTLGALCSKNSFPH